MCSVKAGLKLGSEPGCLAALGCRRMGVGNSGGPEDQNDRH